MRERDDEDEMEEPDEEAATTQLGMGGSGLTGFNRMTWDDLFKLPGTFLCPRTTQDETQRCGEPNPAG